MSSDYTIRERLIELAASIQDSRDRGSTDVDSLEEFHSLLPNTDIEDLCDSDLDEETIVDICLGKKDTRRTLGRDELLELVTQLQSPIAGQFATEAESILATLTFDNNCKHPAKNGLIFYPEEHFNGRSDPSPEEIVEKAIRGE